MNFEILARQALVKWGTLSQLNMVVEECVELIDAIQKYKRNRVDFVSVLEEGVDVECMIEQLKVILGNPVLWQEVRAAKLQRLEKLLVETHKGEGA